MKLPTLEQLLELRGPARHLTLQGSTRVGGLLQGAHRSIVRGRGLEFQEVRLYTAGDDVRSIDWRVTARRGRPHTKLFHEERERTVWLLVDLNPTLLFGSRQRFKSAVAVEAAALLAWVATRDSDRVGAVIVGTQEVTVSAPRLREAGVLPLLDRLVELQPRTPGAAPQAFFKDALRTLTRLARPRSLIFALSDFAAEDSTAQELWSALTSHNDCRLLWITDPLEEQGLPKGRFRVGSTVGTSLVDGGSIRDRWQQAWRAAEQQITTTAERLGMSLTRLSTDMDTMDALQSQLRVAQFVA